jgi:hypothetical protein
MEKLFSHLPCIRLTTVSVNVTEKEPPKPPPDDDESKPQIEEPSTQEQSKNLHQRMVKAVCPCNNGWVREEHPDQLWKPDGCEAAGELCTNPQL